MLTGGAEKEHKRRPAASPDLFRVSKYIHPSSKMMCSLFCSMKRMEYIYIASLIYLVHYMAKTVMIFLSPPVGYYNSNLQHNKHYAAIQPWNMSRTLFHPL